MIWLAMGVVVLVALAVLLAFLRSDRALRGEAATTIAFVADDREVRRELADGRVEAVRWDEITEVEVITTRVGVHGDDGVVLVLGADQTRGCLVPSRLATDNDIIARLSRLPGFDTRALVEAMELAPPSRTTCWRRGS